MNLMICMRGEPEQLPFLPEIAELGAGIELGSYGILGIQSEWDWQARFAMHQVVRSQFQGTLAIHGPFIGMEYDHLDHLIREAVNRRLDLTFDVAAKLKVSRVVLHSGYAREIDLFNLQDSWLKRCAEFWQREIHRWSDAGIEIVLENDTEQSPTTLVRLINAVDHPFLGLCMDIGHQHVFSNLAALDWVMCIDQRLYHIHLHDNDGTRDSHSPIRRGNIDFEPFYEALMQHVPHATLSLEVEDKIEVKMSDLRKLHRFFASR
jgi:sugar phosphate isomerase/epimerase